MDINQSNGYYYGQESEQYTFYRLPKVLFTDERYKNLSDSAKILYGLMLDRMGLSQKNGWVDEYNRVYIIFTLDEIQKYMNCKQDKGVKVLAELDNAKGVGLIERKKQGQGKPTIIYLKKFCRAEVLTSEKPKSAPRKNRSQDFGKSECNKTDNNKTENINNEGIPSYQSINKPVEDISDTDEMDVMDTTSKYRELIKENIEYDLMAERYGQERMDEVLDLMLETLLCTGDSIHIAGSDYDPAFVKERMLKVNALHLEYAFDCLDRNTTRVRNIKAYLLTAIWNAPATISAFYKAQVRHDLYGD